MPHITIEYAILVPVLILQIFLFPLTTSWLMNTWVDSRRNLALQEAASHLGSIMQQMYFSLSHDTILAGSVTQKPDVPLYIENNPYTGNATLRTVVDEAQNSSKILDITFRLENTGITTTTRVILGQNALWKNSTFVSNSANTCIVAEKFENGTILLSFGG